MTDLANRLLALALLGMLLPIGSGCHQPWKFAAAEDRALDPFSTRQMPAQIVALQGDKNTSVQPQSPGGYGAPVSLPPPSIPRQELAAQNANYNPVRSWSDPAVSGVSYEFAPQPSGPAPIGAVSPAAMFPFRAAESPAGPVMEQSPYMWDDGAGSECLTSPDRSKFRGFLSDVRSDYRNYYRWVTMRDLLLGVGVAAPLANTSIDDNFQGWYQREVRGSGTDNFASFWKTFGEGQIFIPAFAGLALVGNLLDDRPVFASAGDFGDRVTRAYLVGGPPMLAMQLLLGGSRPGEVSHESQWRPFSDNNAVSGHAFVGAVPFLTAARMVENPWAKGTLLACSTFPAWSRVNDDAHYLSQVCLGWWMAYLACQAVDDTECRDRCYEFTPIVTPEMSGIGFVWQR